MTEFIKLPSGRWINPACIALVIQKEDKLLVNITGWLLPAEYYGADATALAAALDAMSIKEGM